MEFKNNTYFVDDFLRTHKSKVLLGYTLLSSKFTDKQNRLILQGVKEIDKITQDEINKQREKLTLNAKMYSDITKIVYIKGWKCFKCMEVEKQKKFKDKGYIVNLALHESPLLISQEERKITCPACSSSISLSFIKSEKVILIRIIKELPTIL